MAFRQRVKHEYGEDFFADTRMSFGEHIEELRKHLIRALKWFSLGMILGFVLGKPVLKQITQPVEAAIERYWSNRLDEFKKDPPPGEPLDLEAEIAADQAVQAIKQIKPDAVVPPVSESTPPVKLTLKITNPGKVAYQLHPTLNTIERPHSLRALSATEAFVVWMIVSLIVGLVVSSPLVIYEVWAFVAAGLYPHEKRYVYFLLPFSIGLFLVGVLVCQFLVMPAALDALFSFNAWLQIDPDIRLREWLGFAIIMPVITGLCFETPLVMMFMGLIGVFTAKDFMAYWRVAIFAMLLFAALISPSIDPISLLILWLPMCGLYFLGVLLVKKVERPPPPEEEETVQEVPYDPDMLK